MDLGAEQRGVACCWPVCWINVPEGYQLWRGILWPHVGARDKDCWRRIGRVEEMIPERIEPRKLDVLVV